MVKNTIYKSAVLKKIAGVMLFFCVIGFFCFRFYSANISSFPKTIHAWAQADRYALALNFQKNGFDLFHPLTFNLKPLYPAQDPVTKETGITQVDCPIHEYIIAMIMTAFRNSSPFVFRLYNLLYGILGFFFLFLLVRKNTQSQLKSFAVILFAFLSPVLIFYLNGFLPSTSSLASTLIGYYFYFEYRNNRQFRNLVFAVLFITIAALSRTPFALFLGAVFCQILFDMLKERKVNLKTLLPFLIAFGILLGYFLYNRMLAKYYGSVFLTHIMPVTNKTKLYEILKHIYLVWLCSYFTIYHYMVFLLLGTVFVVQWIRHKGLSAFQKRVGFQFIITLLGSFAYFGLMVAQYHSHDYYFIDSFYIPCLFFILMCIDSLGLKKMYFKVLFVVFLLCFGYLSFGKCREDINSRYKVNLNNQSGEEAENFSGSEKYLDLMKINADAKILVINAYSENIPLILMNRKGYCLMANSEDNIRASFTWDFDYIVMQNEYIPSDVVSNFPGIIDELEPIGSNGKISIYTMQYRKKSLREFLQIKDHALFCKTSCPEQYDSCAETISKKLSCDSVFIIKPENEFMDIVKCDISTYDTKGLNLIFSCDCRLNKFNKENTDIVVNINRDDEQVYYKSFSLNQYRRNEVTSDYLNLSFLYPLHFEGEGEFTLSLYVWNNGRNQIELKNIGIWILGKTK